MANRNRILTNDEVDALFRDFVKQFRAREYPDAGQSPANSLKQAADEARAQRAVELSAMEDVEMMR